MQPVGGRTGRWIGTAALGCVPFAMQITLIMARSSSLGTILVWAELAILAVLAVVRFKRHRVWAVLAVALLAIIQVFHSANGAAVLVASGVSHSAAYAGLLVLFGSSLLPGRRPLISIVSERLGGKPLSPEIARYTRRVTIAWCCFFVLQLLCSMILLLSTSSATWSFFVNVLNAPLVVTMFVCEYAWRRWRFPAQPHWNIQQVMGAFRGTDVRNLRQAQVQQQR